MAATSEAPQEPLKMQIQGFYLDLLNETKTWIFVLP